MKMDRGRVKRILVIGLSNIGDAVLTTPVIQRLREHFAQAHLALLIGPRAFGVFKNDRRVDQKIIYDKSISWRNKWRLFNRLRLDHYDLVVDLRQSLMGIFLGARYHTSVIAKAPKSLTHMQARHLWKLKSLGLHLDGAGPAGPTVQFSENEQSRINQLLDRWRLKARRSLVAVAPGARNQTKRWERQGYRQLIERLIKECQSKVIIVGDEADAPLAEEISSQIKPAPYNACGQTSIGELSFLLSKCRLLVTNDSAPMHLGWAANIPVIAIFGPTDYRKYAPGGSKDIIISRKLDCSPCEESLCFKGTRQCMKVISADEVFAACKRILDEQLPKNTN